MDIYDLIAEGEHQQQDFKYCISSVSKIAHTLSAFANTDGGRLLVGVRDNGRIAGVVGEEEIYMIDAAASSYCSPAVDCQMDTVRAEGRTVLIATISASEHRPIQAIEEDGTRRAYIRLADENILASPVHLALWHQESHGTSRVFTEDEMHLLRIIPAQGMTLNRFTRQSRLSRHQAVRLLSHYVRYGLISMVWKSPHWIFLP